MADDLATALRTATARLAAAGVPSPRADAEALAAHLLATSRGQVLALALRGAPAPHGYEELVARRAARTPLQHLTGRAAFRTVELAVGPGVFVPRPETEVTAGLAVQAAQRVAASGASPLVVDLCTGSGAIALAVATEVSGARVHAVELDPAAHAWALRNLAGSGVRLHLADAASALPELDGAVDVVVSNPPYVPPGAVPREVEVREHDPARALYGGGPDGLDVPRAVVATAARLLRPGGVVAVEHAEVQQEALLALLGAPSWVGAVGHADLAGRPRCVVAQRTGSPAPR
ncbi:peptide chain release factor N(5)-glutamine methyltransferase [Quadrisphaera sp. DSM 44207]|uniref:peptide chain release factor N(5)-glutamine methyltransferase n=1 Tax=Quadrisphaera sp. DSM 44207 TaxID=1881057 RepID=UPI00088B54AE|nr:peptide chain release factor N(5)-glutamine methyltransferase [Quadrisphaera sp. DSM 44207]SDQ73339.1 release factor glutamine methyltransferase [Quadrisphaera sp. DSM 44207]